MLLGLAVGLMLLWPVIEGVIAITQRARQGEDERISGGSALLIWLVALASVGATVAFALLRVLPFPVLSEWIVVVGAVIVAAGAAIRLVAIAILGPFFTVDVTVADDHQLVTRGPYRLVRHPTYSGLLISFFGMGVATQSWAGLVTAVIPMTVALLYRIRIEECALMHRFGEGYGRYCRRTKRLVPWIF